MFDKIAGSDERMKKEIHKAITNVTIQQITATNYNYSLFSEILETHRKEINNDINRLDKNNDKIIQLENKVKNVTTAEKKRMLTYLRTIEQLLEYFMVKKDKKYEKIMKEISEIKILQEQKSTDSQENKKLFEEVKNRVKELQNKDYFKQFNIGALVNFGIFNNAKVGNVNSENK